MSASNYNHHPFLRILRRLGVRTSFDFIARLLILSLITFFLFSQTIGLQHRNSHFSTFLGKTFVLANSAATSQLEILPTDRVSHSCSLFEAASIADCIAPPILNLATSFPHQLIRVVTIVTHYYQLPFLHFSSRAPPSKV